MAGLKVDTRIRHLDLAHMHLRCFAVAGQPERQGAEHRVTFRFWTVVAAILASASAVRKALCGEMSTFGKLLSSWNFLAAHRRTGRQSPYASACTSTAAHIRACKALTHTPHISYWILHYFLNGLAHLSQTLKPSLRWAMRQSLKNSEPAPRRPPLIDAWIFGIRGSAGGPKSSPTSAALHACSMVVQSLHAGAWQVHLASQAHGTRLLRSMDTGSVTYAAPVCR